MPGKKFQLKPLESRKQLLLVESELNRAQLVNEWRTLKNEFDQFKSKMETISSLASSAAKLATTVSAIGNAFTHRGDTGEKGKSSWFSTLWKGARTGASIWGAVRSHLK